MQMPRQIVLMTGCSAGIGLATAKRLSLDPDQRYIVIATIIAMSEKNDLVTAVGDALKKTIFIEELDVTRDTDITTVVEETLKEYGRIDILPWPYLEVYNSNKFALEGYFEALAVGLRAFNIRVCLVEPGGVKTNLLRESIKSVEHLLQDGSIEESDRRQLEVMMGIIGEDQGPTKVTSDTVAEAIMTRCIDPEKPVLRHFLADEFYENVQAGLTDMTGEKAVASSQKMF